MGLGQPYAVSALHGRGSGDLLDALLAALPSPPSALNERRAARAAPGGAGRQAQRRQVLAAQPAGQRGAGGRRPGGRDHSGPGRQPRRRSAARPGCSSTPPGCAARWARPAGPSTTRACARPAPSRRPRWRWCSSTPPSRSASRTSGCSTMVTEAGRALVIAFNKWDLVDGDRRLLPRQGDRPGAASASRGRCGSTSRPRPGGRWTSSPRRCARRWRAGTSGSRPGRLNQFITSVVQAHAAPGARRPVAAGALRDPGRHPTAAVRAVHLRPARRRATCASSSASCARSSASRARRSTSRCGPARSATSASTGPLWRPSPGSGAGHRGPPGCGRSTARHRPRR